MQHSARWERGELEIRHPELVSLALDRLENQATNHAKRAPHHSPRANLPAESTSFIGPPDEIDAVCRQLAGTTLVTLRVGN
jgi:hypothetical protein